MHRPPLVLGAVLVAGCAPVKPASDPLMTVRELRASVDPAVRVSPKPIPESENGWDLINAAASMRPKTTGIQKEDTVEALLASWSKPEQRDLVARGERAIHPYDSALDLLAKGLKRPYYAMRPPADDQIKEFGGDSATYFPQFAGLRSLAKVLALRARVRLSEGKPSEAADDLIRLHELGDRIVTGPGTLIQYLVGVAVEAIADRTVQTMAKDPDWRDADLRRVLAAFDEPRNGMRMATTLRTEFDTFFLPAIAGWPDPAKGLKTPASSQDEKTIGEILAGNPKPFDRKATIREVSRVYAVLVANATAPWNAQRPVEPMMDAWIAGWPKALFESDAFASESNDEEEPKERVSGEEIRTARQALADRPNALGLFVAAQMMPVFAQTGSIERREQAGWGATRVILARRLYVNAHHAEPPSLDALVASGLLKSVPTDPFDGKPLRYDPARRVVWSVGADGKDDGGHDRPGEMSALAKDFVWPTDGVFPDRTPMRPSVQFRNGPIGFPGAPGMPPPPRP